MQSSYVLLLDDKLKLLGHFTDEVFQASSDYDVFYALSVNWIPCIKQQTILQPLRNLWDSHLREHLQSWKKAEKEAVRQITQATALVRQRLKEKKLLKKKRRITNRLVLIERILNGKE